MKTTRNKRENSKQTDVVRMPIMIGAVSSLLLSGVVSAQILEPTDPNAKPSLEPAQPIQNVAESANLTLKWQAGKSYVYRFENKVQRRKDGQLNMKTSRVFKVKSKPLNMKAGVLLQSKWLHLSSFESEEGKVISAEDTSVTKKKETSLGKRMKKQVGKEFDIKLGVKNEVIYPKPKPNKADPGKSKPFNIGDEAFKEKFPKDCVLDSFRWMSQMLSNKEVKIGETWQAHAAINDYLTTLESKEKFTFRLESITKQDGKTLAKVSFEKLIPDGKNIFRAHVVTLKHLRTNGHYLFDVEQGQIHKLTVTEEMAFLEKGEESGLTVEQTNTIDLLEKAKK